MKIVFLFSWLLLLKSTFVNSQSTLPSYFEVAKYFFSNYSYVKEEPYDKIFFAKKKEGWFIEIVDQLRDDSVKNKQLFWHSTEHYKPLTGFDVGVSQINAQKKVDEMLKSDDAPFVYGYERCRYFGYNEWDADMIRDFGNMVPENDTLLEGMGRAYANYAERYLWHGLGGHPFDDDPLKTKLRKLEIPNKNRVERFIFYVNKSAECYRILSKRNPDYKVLVGSAKMKFLNEQFHQYQQLMMCGYANEAAKVVKQMDPNDSIYRRIGRTYLGACPPNTVLITLGDNDCYGAWYVQLIDGFRPDVTVLNYSLLGFPPYLKNLKQINPKLFTTDVTAFRNVYYEYFPLVEDTPQQNNGYLPLAEFIENLQKVKYPYPGSIDTLSSYVSPKVQLDIDVNRVTKICDQNNLVSSMKFELNNYLLLNDLIILDILRMVIHERPMCMTAPASPIPEKYLQKEGPVYRILPLNEDARLKTEVEVKKAEKFLNADYYPTVLTYRKNSVYYEDALLGLHERLFSDLINNYLLLSDSLKAKEWAGKYLAHPGTKKLSPTYSTMQMAYALIITDYPTEGKIISEKLAEKLLTRSKNYSAIEYYYSRDDLLEILNYLRDLLSWKGIESNVLEKAITEISAQKDK